MPKPTNVVFAWSWQGRAMPVAYDIIGEAAGPPILFLPAMSTVSTRAEMAPLAQRLADVGRPVLVDWPGFGDAPRAALDYGPEICRAFLKDFLDHLVKHLGNRKPAVIAAGHAPATRSTSRRVGPEAGAGLPWSRRPGVGHCRR
jgi:pimeloyl-ACP methyl ester carboxylesterase